ncbi:MAG TPA: hypothetical protein VNB59_07165 [Solirubrobacterales bacterium]|jgi:hypothetical protein|nr:hypothetical protein [Solirubrobacterales bacterium]
MALFASSASATRLCTAEGVGEKCTAGFYGAPTLLEANLVPLTNWVMQEGFAKLECSSSNLSGRLTSSGGGLGVSVGFKLESITWGGICTCPKIEQWALVPWNWPITGTGNKDGEILATPISLKTECMGETCLYESQVMHAIRGGKPARLEMGVKLPPQKGSGPKCANPTVLTAEYIFATPSALFVTKE